jgi:hypothetical protein
MHPSVNIQFLLYFYELFNWDIQIFYKKLRIIIIIIIIIIGIVNKNL